MVFTRKSEQYALRDDLGNTVICAAKRYRLNKPAFIVIGGRLPTPLDPEGLVFVKHVCPDGRTTDCVTAAPSAYGLKWQELKHELT